MSAVGGRLNSVEVGQLGVQVGMSDDWAERFAKLCRGYALAGLSRFLRRWGNDASWLRGIFVDLLPGARRPVAHVVHVAGLGSFPCEQANFSEVLYVDEVDVLFRRSHVASPDPLRRIPVRSVNAGHPQDGPAVLGAQVFFSLDPGFGSVDEGRFVGPWGWVGMGNVVRNVVSGRASQDDQTMES